jgi:AcrR family transcriptional regulator
MADTKENILQAALRLFAQDGYEAVSVSAIAAELGVTKPALYKHYKSKRDIFDHIVERMAEADMQ